MFDGEVDYELFGVKKRIDAFCKRHGEFVCDESGWIYHENGAHRDRNPLGLLAEPDQDLYERSKMIVRYWELKHDLAVEEFQNYKNHQKLIARSCLTQQVPGVVTNQTEARKQLVRLKKKVVNNQRKLDTALAQVEANEPKWMQERENQNQRFRQKAQELLSTVEAIEI
jgi:hypothetical protein